MKVVSGSLDSGRTIGIYVRSAGQDHMMIGDHSDYATQEEEGEFGIIVRYEIKKDDNELYRDKYFEFLYMVEQIKELILAAYPDICRPFEVNTVDYFTEQVERQWFYRAEIIIRISASI